MDRGESFEIFCSEQKIWERSCFGSGILFASGKGASGMSIIVYFVMITEDGNKKVVRSVIRSRKVVILCVITEDGNKNIVCFVIHRIKLVILEDITDSGE